MLVDTVLSTFVVIRSYGKQCVRADRAGVCRKLTGVRGVVASAARNDRHSPMNLLYHKFDDALSFFIAHRGRLARRAADNKCIDSVCELFFYQTAERCIIYSFIGKRRYECRCHSFEYRG